MLRVWRQGQTQRMGGGGGRAARDQTRGDGRRSRGVGRGGESRGNAVRTGGAGRRVGRQHLHGVELLLMTHGLKLRPLLLIDHMEATRQVSRIAQEPRSRYFGEGSFEQLHDDAANTAALDPLKRLLVAAFTPPHGDNEAFAHRMKTGFGVIVALLRRIWDPRCTHGMLSKITAVIDQALPVSQIKTLYNGTLLFEYSRQVGCFASRPPPEISAQHTTLNENYIYH